MKGWWLLIHIRAETHSLTHFSERERERENLKMEEEEIGEVEGVYGWEKGKDSVENIKKGGFKTQNLHWLCENMCLFNEVDRVPNRR